MFQLVSSAWSRYTLVYQGSALAPTVASRRLRPGRPWRACRKTTSPLAPTARRFRTHNTDTGLVGPSFFSLPPSHRRSAVGVGTRVCHGGLVEKKHPPRTARSFRTHIIDTGSVGPSLFSLPPSHRRSAVGVCTSHGQADVSGHAFHIPLYLDLGVIPRSALESLCFVDDRRHHVAVG